MKALPKQISQLKTVILGATVLLSVLFSSALWALDLQDAKKQGLVGETVSGYIAPVGSLTPEIKALVSSVNDQRKVEYQRLAQKNNISVADIEALAGKKAIEKTPAGQYVNAGGQWQKK